MSERRPVPLIHMPEAQCDVALPACARSHRWLVSISDREVSGVVAVLAGLNVVVSFLLTARPLPAWLELHRLASDLDTTAMMGAAHVGAACLVILLASRKLFFATGRRAQLLALGAMALVGTLVALNRYWAHPLQQEPQPQPIVMEPAGIPLHGSLPGGR